MAEKRRRRAAAAKVSMLHHYGRRAAGAVLAILSDDPWAAEEPARRRPPPRGAQTANPGAAEWVAPPKRPIEVYASRRDVIAGMYARGQIDRAMFAAARDYERLYATAAALPVRTADPTRPAVSGAGRGAEEAIDAVRRAAARLRRIETRLARRYGVEAVLLVRDVIGRGQPVHAAAAGRGEGDRPRREWWGGLLRRALAALAEICGHAVEGAYDARRRSEARAARAARARPRQKRQKRQKRGQQ